MPVYNADIAQIFNEVADLLEIGEPEALKMAAENGKIRELEGFGAKAHNIAVCRSGRKKGLKINEYGVYKDDERVAGRTEKSVFEKVDLPFIEPELREDRGEIQAAEAGRLPDLVRLRDIRGDLHARTSETDGRNSLAEMVAAARDRGYDYLAISNHSKSVTVAKGLYADGLQESIEKMSALEEKLDNFKILKVLEYDTPS